MFPTQTCRNTLSKLLGAALVAGSVGLGVMPLTSVSANPTLSIDDEERLTVEGHAYIDESDPDVLWREAKARRAARADGRQQIAELGGTDARLKSIKFDTKTGKATAVYTYVPAKQQTPATNL